MPIYEYACASCGARFEKLQASFRESARCPRCQGEDVERLLSRFAMTASAGAGPAPEPSGSGGCCGGGGCGCRH